MVICLERGADLHTAQLMPLSLTVSCFSEIQIDFTFLVLAHPGSPRKRAVKQVCVCITLHSSRTASTGSERGQLCQHTQHTGAVYPLPSHIRNIPQFTRIHTYRKIIKAHEICFISFLLLPLC